MSDNNRWGRRFLLPFFIILVVGVLIGYHLFLSLSDDNSFSSLKSILANEKEVPQSATSTQIDQAEPVEVSDIQTTLPVDYAISERLLLFEPSSVQELQNVLDEIYDKDSIFPKLVVNLAPKKLPPGLAKIHLKRRKSIFIKSLLPIIISENEKITKNREVLLSLKEIYQREGKISGEQRQLLKQFIQNYSLSSQFSLSHAPDLEKIFPLLQDRIDIIPPSLVVAQAAIESGWGTSRFLLEGNNLFGQWIFNSEKGIIPAGRPAGATYRIASFVSLPHSVRSYLKNLNTGWAYQELREQRARQRREKGNLNSLVLAEELSLYSIRREAYVKELQGIIKANNLQALDRLSPHIHPLPEVSSLTMAFLRERSDEQID